MKRASTEEKKEARRATILGQARIWIAERSFDEIRLTDLARALGLVKGTLYLYFPTKQDLFASILVEEMETWWKELLARPARRSPGKDLASGLAVRGLLLRLLSSLHMTIEPGLTPAGLAALKAWFRGFAARAAADLERRYPGLRRRGFPFLLAIYAQAVGAAQLAFPPERVRTLLLKDPSLTVFLRDFGSFYADSVDALYRGMRTGSERKI